MFCLGNYQIFDFTAENPSIFAIPYPNSGSAL